MLQSSPTWLIIANPTSGSGKTAKRWPQIEAMLQARQIPFEVVFTKYSQQAIELAQKGIQEGFRHIIGIGGDGTNHEIINGIIGQTVVPSQEITYTLLPVGTGNDWVKTYNIPKNLKKWMDYLQQGKTTLQDIGIVKYQSAGQSQKRYFTNVAGMAYDGFVVEYIESRKAKARGPFAYLWNVIKCLWKYELSPAKICFNGKTVEDVFYTINVGICRYSGNGMQFVPHAQPNDGLLALTYAQKVSKWSVIWNTPRFYTGTIARHPRIFTHQSQHIRVEALDSPVLLEADGEFLGTTPVEFSILEKALKIVVP